MLAAFTHIVDYAGLFPPASLSMDDAVREYRDHLAGPHRWMLGRFVVAGLRLDELAESVVRQQLIPSGHEPWQLSVVLGANIVPEVARLAEFRRDAIARGLHVVAVETRVTSPGQISVVGEQLPDDLERYLEVPHEGPYGQLAEAIQAAGAFAKIRTGGTTPEAFPSPDQLTLFLIAMNRLRLPFKATAGLHHPFAGDYPLTYESDSPRYRMHGFVNLLLATAELRMTRDSEQAQAILEEEDPTVFHREANGWRWRDSFYPTAVLHDVRELFIGFGSCSFHEPVVELAMDVMA